MIANNIAPIKCTHIRAHRSKPGFTLIELLVVIALTSILLTVVFKPLVSSLQLTNRAATQTQSQSASRDAVSQVESALSLAEYVLDPTMAPINLWLTQQPTSAQLAAGQAGSPYAFQSQFTMMEYIPSAHQLDQLLYTPGFPGPPIDPTTGLPSYQNTGLSAAQKGLAFPLANSQLLGRLFIGLTNNYSGPGVNGANGTPVNPYFNFYEWANTDSSDPNKLTGINGRGIATSSSNTFTLYRAEVATYIPDPTVPASPTQSYIPNLMLFHTGADSASLTNMKDGPIILEDPNFFYDNSLAGGNDPTAGTKIWAVPGWKDINGDGKVEIWENWAAVSSSLIRTDKVDLMSLARDPLTNGILYTAQPSIGTANYPTPIPLATFKPAFVQNDPAVPTNLEQAGVEQPITISPNFTSQYDHWTSNFRVFVYRSNGSGTDPTQNNPLDYYEGIIVPPSYQGTPLPNPGAFKIVHVSQATGFNIAPGQAGPDPSNPALPDVSGQFLNGVFSTSPIFSFAANSDKGLVSFGYPSTSIMHTPSTATPANAPLAQRYSPDDINNAYLPYTFPAGVLGPGSRRFLSLAAPLSTANWGGNPLNPTTIPATPLAPSTPPQSNTLVTPSMVPGSELVFGPDQMPGVHYGHRIQYTRVSSAAGVAGPNQYKVVYTNNSNTPGGIGNSAPSLAAGYIEFNSQPDGNYYNAGTFYNGGNGDDLNLLNNVPPALVPATGTNMLPIWKFNPATSAVDGTLNSDPVEVYYSFQMNQPGDVVKMDYMTRALMIFTLEMRLYDQGSGKAQITRLTDKIKVRNLQH